MKINHRNGAVSATAAALALTAILTAPGASAATDGPRGLHDRGSRTTQSGGALVDHGGRILPASRTYLVFWGARSAWSSDVEGGLQTLFQGFNGSSYLGIAGQYMRNAPLSSTYVTTVADPTTPPNKVSPSTLGNEVVKEFGGTIDPSALYLVYTSNFPRGGNFCAWHSLASASGSSFSVAYMPNTAGVAGCDPGNLYGVPGSEGLRSLANVSAHEYMETVTDALPASGSYAWIDQSGGEIGDKCAWQFAGPVTLADKSTWQLQEEWSNSANGCAQG